MRIRALAAAALLLACALPAAAGPRLSPAAAAQLDEGLQRLYSLDYAQSRAAFRKLIELEPDNPFGYLFEAGGIWWESSQEFGLFKDTPTLQGLFEQDVDAALRKADAYIDSKDPQTKADGYFVSGMALGTQGQWRLMKGHWLDAYSSAKKAIKNLRKCVKLDPQYYDAQLGLGVFDYQAARLSGIAKLGAMLILRGDEKRGLAELQLAIDKSRYSSRQALNFVLCIHLLDRRDYASALPVVRQLREKVPGSPYYQFLEILIRDHLGDEDGSLALARELAGRVEAGPSAFRPKWLTLVCGLSGETCLNAPDARSALAWFDRAVESAEKEKPSAFATLLHLSRGQLLDILGRREEAVAEYRETLALPDIDFAHRRAAECSDRPCSREETLAALRALSKETDEIAAPGNGNVTPLR